MLLQNLYGCHKIPRHTWPCLTAHQCAAAHRLGTIGLNSNSVVRFVSWNVKGLNGPVKRARVLSHLKSFNADILFLQETHLRLKDHIRLRKAWISQVYHSRHDGSSKGVAILINRSEERRVGK